MVSKALVGIILTLNILMGLFIFYTGTQSISTLSSSYPVPQNKPIVSYFNFWNIEIVPYYYMYPSGTPVPIVVVPSVYYPTYGFIFMLIVNTLFGLMLLRKTKEEGTEESS